MVEDGQAQQLAFAAATRRHAAPRFCLILLKFFLGTHIRILFLFDLRLKLKWICNSQSCLAFCHVFFLSKPFCHVMSRRDDGEAPERCAAALPAPQSTSASAIRQAFPAVSTSFLFAAVSTSSADRPAAARAANPLAVACGGPRSAAFSRGALRQPA